MLTLGWSDGSTFLPINSILLSTENRKNRINDVKDGKTIPAKVVYVRNKNKKNEYLCLISTDATLDEEEIIRIYGKRWDIEVFFKVCKSYLNLSKDKKTWRVLHQKKEFN